MTTTSDRGYVLIISKSLDPKIQESEAAGQCRWTARGNVEEQSEQKRLRVLVAHLRKEEQ